MSDIDQLNQELFQQSDIAWRDGNLQLAFDLQDKITGLSDNNLAALLIRAGYLLLENSKFAEAIVWFNLAEEYITPNKFYGLPFLFANKYIMSALGRIKAYRLTNKLDSIHQEIVSLVKWLSKSEREILKEGLASTGEYIDKFLGREESLLALNIYPFWVDIDFGENTESYYSFSHDIDTITFLYENAEKITKDVDQQAVLTVLYGYYVVLNTQESGYEKYENLLRQVNRESRHPAIKSAAREHARTTVLAIQENWLEDSLIDVDIALELDPNNTVLLEFQKRTKKEKSQLPNSTKQMSVQLISTELTPIARDSIFFSPPEQRIYEIMVKMFSDHLVLPNAALHTIINYKELQKVVNADEFRFYLQTHVDFCIVDKKTYRPVLGFELDSSFHDTPQASEKDRRKNLFFRLAKIPLVRLRDPDGLTDSEIETELFIAVQNARVGKVS
jgi:hypothetical protein